MLGVGPGNSGITGDVEVVKGSDAFTLTIRVHGLPPNSNHVSHIHLGSCEVNGAIDVPLQTLAADANFACTALQVDRWTSRRVPTFAYELNDDGAPPRKIRI